MQHETDELEPQQYQRHYWEDDVPLADVRKSALRKAVYIGAGLFVLIILAGALVKFPDEVSLPFVLRGETPERIYRFPYPVYLEEAYGAPGMKVKGGTPLARITAPQIVTLITNYRQASDALANYRLHKPRSLADTRDIVRLQAAQNMHRLREINDRRAALESTWKSNAERLRFELEDASKRLAQHQALYRSRDISAMELKEHETARMRAADALNTATEAYQRDAAALREEAARYSLQNTSLNREEDRVTTDARTDSATLINQLALAADAIRHTFGDFEISGGSLILKAPADGVLSFLFEGDREVPASAILLKVTHQSGGLYAAAISPPSLIGKLKKGQTAYLKVATFPAYEWGAAKGHIDYLSLAPDEKGLFNIRISLDEQRRLANRLQPGMDGILAVQLDERSFFQYFFRNMQKAKYVLSGE
jgi:hypothetical protein